MEVAGVWTYLPPRYFKGEDWKTNAPLLTGVCLPHTSAPSVFKLWTVAPMYVCTVLYSRLRVHVVTLRRRELQLCPSLY